MTLSFDQKCPLLRLKNGRVRFSSKGKIARFNCMRTYQLVGVKYVSCIRGQWDAEVPVCVRPGCHKTYSSNVNGQFFESYRGAVVKVVCNPGYTLIGSSSVYCNGIAWNETFPRCKAAEPNPLKSCQFETDDLCGWSQDPIHDIDWKRQNHLNLSGYYMHIESSASGRNDDIARLYSPVFPASYSNDNCFKFKYFMKGIKNGFFKIYVKLEDRELYNTIPSFWSSGDQEPDWSVGFFDIEKSDSPFQIVIEANRGSGYESDIAFDDVNITESTQCVANEETTTTISSSTDSEDDEDSLSCKNRCNQEPVYNDTTITPEDVSEIPKCDCHSGCLNNKTCCADYSYFCAVVATSSKASVATSSKATVAIKTSTTLLKMSVTTQLPSTKAPTKTTKSNATVNKTEDRIQNRWTSTPYTVPTVKTFNASNNNESNDVSQVPRTIPEKKVTMKNNSDKSFDRVKITSPEKKTNATLGTTRATLSNTQIYTKKSTSPKPVKKVDKQNTTMTFSGSTTVSVAFTSLKVKMPLLVNPSILLLDSKTQLQNRKTAGKESPQAMKSDVEKTKMEISVINIVGSAAALLALIAFIAGVIMMVIRRRRKRYERENMVEDSDVRFLTSDEVLDFTLARPADDDL